MGTETLLRAQVLGVTMACKNSGSLPNWTQGLGRYEAPWMSWR